MIVTRYRGLTHTSISFSCNVNSRNDSNPIQGIDTVIYIIQFYLAYSKNVEAGSPVFMRGVKGKG